ncbi:MULTISPECIES: restriction endonuclease subunit S [unclassified Pseudoalteromonas]|uniref:restriction endonuclease subunit S n=1 Tax=unclassified Pseudoalteromonas TaxID=194690 RepID=UPI00041F9F11|nr:MULTISPECIES: restriction endonuclease subunit S [unclassified Pseudoalteromonas]
MSGVRTVLLKDICNFEKGSTGLMKSEPGEYPLVTTGKDRRSCESYQFDTKAVCIPLVSSTGHGHASLNNVHYQEGKFALGTILVALTAKNEEELDVHFLHLYLSQLKNVVLVPLMKGAANVSLSITAIKNIEIPLPSIIRQKTITAKFHSIVNEENKLNSELFYQRALLDKLKIQIIKDSIEGNLTKQWREIYPQNNLNNQVNVISDSTPYPLPESWYWCRFGEVIKFVSGNSFQSSDFQKSDGIKCIKITNAGVQTIIETDDRLPLSFKDKYPNYLVSEGDIILALTRPYISNGLKVSLCSKSYDGALLNQRVALIKPDEKIVDREYCFYFLTSDFVLKGYKDEFDSKGQQPNLRKDHVTDLFFPLPPLKEQKEIVRRIKQIADIHSKLLQKNTQNQIYAKSLMEAVLKEEFSN